MSWVVYPRRGERIDYPVELLEKSWPSPGLVLGDLGAVSADLRGVLDGL